MLVYCLVLYIGNRTVQYTFLQGDTFYLQEGCSQLYPATISASFTDSSDPIPLVNGEICDGNNVVYAYIESPLDTHVPVIYELSAYDDCDRNATVEASIPSCSYFPIGNTNVTLTATDSAGFTGTCNFTVTVLNSTAPTVSSPTQSPWQIVCPSQSPSVDPSLSPTLIPSLTPSLIPTKIPSTHPSLTPTKIPSLSPRPTFYDVSPPICTDISEEITFTFFRGIAVDIGEDANENGMIDAGEDANSNGELERDSGISAIELHSSSVNLELNYTFEIGDKSVVIDGNRINEAMNASGTIEVFDRRGRSCIFNVDLEPFNRTLFEEEIEFPSAVHQLLFKNESQDDVPLYSLMDFSEMPGNYTALHENSTFVINVTEIIVHHGDLINETLSDPDMPSDVIEFLQEDGYSACIVGAIFESDNITAKVVALAFTYADIAPLYNVIALYDYSDFLSDYDAEDNIDALEPPNRELQAKSQFQGLIPFQDPHMNQGRRLSGCSSGIDRIKCPPGQTRSVDSTCISAARFTFNQAVAVAQGDYDTAIAIAKGIRDTASAGLLALKARRFAKKLIPCILIGLLSGVSRQSSVDANSI